MATVSVEEQVIKTYNVSLSEKEASGLYSLLYSGLSSGAEEDLSMGDLRRSLGDAGVDRGFGFNKVIERVNVSRV